MMNWSAAKSIKDILTDKWNKGHYFEYLIDTDIFEPIKIKLKSPDKDEVNLNFSGVIAWVEQLRQSDKSHIGYGYEFIEHNFRNSVTGNNTPM